MKTAEEFRQQAIKNGISHWKVHDCSMCKYGCGYLFFQYVDAEVAYDNGCDCVHRYVVNAKSWEDVAEFYNAQRNPDIIKEMNEYWGFN